MIGERLAKARKAAGLTQVQFAVALGDCYNAPMISTAENGRSGLLLDGAVKAARELGVSLDYLAGLTDDPTPSASLSRQSDAAAGIDDNALVVPVRKLAAAAGSGALVFDETVVGYMTFRRDWLNRQSIDPAYSDVIRVSGDSMSPTLPDGCSILVDRTRRELQPRRIYVLRNEEGLVVKRVNRNRDGW